MSPAFNARLAAAHPVIALWREAQADRAAALARLARDVGVDVGVVVTSSRYGCDAGLMAALPGLRVVCSFGVGYDSIDMAAARARGIAVTNTPDVLNGCVADLAVGLILDVARRISAADRFVRAGGWGQGGALPGRRVHGARLGIVGLGRIGAQVARRAQGFDMQVAYHNRKPDPTQPYRYEPDLRALAAWADYLVLTCPGGPATCHLIGAAELDALGPDGVLINVARGSVVDEGALVAALTERRIAGAGLDVYEDEPHVPAALMGLDNVVLLPHIASNTIETRAAMEDLLFDNIQAAVTGGRLPTPVT